MEFPIYFKQQLSERISIASLAGFASVHGMSDLLSKEIILNLFLDLITEFENANHNPVHAGQTGRPLSKVAAGICFFFF
jgi:hypothetical protein